MRWKVTNDYYKPVFTSVTKDATPKPLLQSTPIITSTTRPKSLSPSTNPTAAFTNTYKIITHSSLTRVDSIAAFHVTSKCLLSNILNIYQKISI